MPDHSEDKVHLDFETRSDLDIKVVGGFRYAEDRSTETLIVAFSLGREEPTGVDLTQPWAKVKSALEPLFDAVDKGRVICAHNAHFERNIWELQLDHWPVAPRATQWSCTAARARMLALPGSLDGAALALGVNTRKDKRGTELINLFSKPQKRKGELFWVQPHERPEDFEAFIEYCCQDVRVERELDRILPDLSPVEQATFLLDYKINSYGMPVNMDRVRKADAFVEEYSAALQKRCIEISGYKPTQREKTLEFLKRRGHTLPNLQALTVEAFAKTEGLAPDLVELMDHRIELSRAGTKKLKAIQNCVSDDGRVRGGFLYSAASTRRWSSTGVQMHNLQKPEGETDPEIALSLLDDDPFDLCLMFNRPLTVLAQSIRGFFESEETFLIADYSSVEPRGLAWSADESWMLEAYVRNEDAYKIAAGRVYGVPPTQVDSAKRFMGKQLVLGCGYGMGPPRFVEACAKFGRILTLDQSSEAVYAYRNSVPNIVKFWRQVEMACIRATRDWKNVQVGQFTFRPETLANGFRVLYVDMPSGTIAYPKPSLGTSEWNGEIRSTFNFYTPLGSSWIKTDTFGGSLVENIIQALTRDILRDGLLAADKAGFRIPGHVHDEAIAEGTESKDDLRQFEELLCNSSEWAEGFPIRTEGFMSKVYTK